MQTRQIFRVYFDIARRCAQRSAVFYSERVRLIASLFVASVRWVARCASYAAHLLLRVLFTYPALERPMVIDNCFMALEETNFSQPDSVSPGDCLLFF